MKTHGTVKEFRSWTLVMKVYLNAKTCMRMYIDWEQRIVHLRLLQNHISQIVRVHSRRSQQRQAEQWRTARERGSPVMSRGSYPPERILIKECRHGICVHACNDCGFLAITGEAIRTLEGAPKDAVGSCEVKQGQGKPLTTRKLASTSRNATAI